MSIHQKILAALGIGLTVPMPVFAATSAPIVNGEDIAPIPGSPWIIVSSMAGGDRTSGKIAAFNRRSGKVVTLYPDGREGGLATTGGCAKQVMANEFKPHGIALQRGDDGKNRLYVVNHGGRESVEIFELDNRKLPRLTWTGCAIKPPGVFGNGVAPQPDGSFFMTNMGDPLDGSKPAVPMTGEIVSWNEKTGWKAVPDSSMIAPNGLVTSHDGKRIYVAAWAGREIVELTPGETGTRRRVLAVDFLPDNLRWSNRGTILAAGHRTSPQVVMDCYMSTRTHCVIPSAIAEIDPEMLATKCTWSVGLDMTTVATTAGKEIWLGTARGDKVVRMPSDTPCDDTPVHHR